MHPLVEMLPGWCCSIQKSCLIAESHDGNVLGAGCAGAQRRPCGLPQNKNINPGENGAKGEDYMALKVIGAGFGRTGTWSIFAALNRLGFP